MPYLKSFILTVLIVVPFLNGCGSSTTSKQDNDAGFKLMNQRKEKQAIEKFNSAISKDKKNFQAYANRGLTHKRMANFKNAESDYTKAISLKPKLGLLYRNRGVLYAQSERPKLALKDYNQALKLNPKDWECLSSRAVVYQKLNQPSKALSDFNASLKINPKDGITYLQRGVHLCNEGNKNGIADIKKAVKMKVSGAANVLKQFSR